MAISAGFLIAAAQTDTIPPFKKSPYIPAFKILQTDSTWFAKENIPKNKPVIIIYFSPDCGHCQITAKEFAEKMNELDDVFMVWVSRYAPQEVKKFGEEYKLNQFANVRLGTDTKYFIPVFYDVRFTPFMAVYDKKGKLLETYPQGTGPDTVAKLLHKKS